MFPRVSRRWILVLLVALLVSIAPAGAASAAPDFNCAGVTEIPLAECQALEALYTSTNGAQWYDRAGWISTNTPCSWYGVTCQAGRVSELDLSDNNLAGPLPAQLANLARLRTLALARNDLTGSAPAWLGSLAQLQTLDLSVNQLTGAIPAQLSNLTSLQTLNLGNNQLSGAIPSQLGSLASLQVLNLSSNALTGTIPAVLGSLSNLRDLSLQNNQLSGTIPAQLATLGALQRLVLLNNNLEGAIPPGLGGLSNLTHLILASNQLSGAIPAQLSNLGQLQILMLNSNRLTGAIPSVLGNLANLSELYLNSNAFSGDVPASLCGISTMQVDGVRLDFNALRSAPDCSNIDLSWYETQTVAPEDLSGRADDVRVTLQWTPIAYQSDGGYYEISYRPAGGTFTVHGVTADKSVRSYVVTGLAPETNYELRVRTFTPAHNTVPAFQQNDLWSEYAVVEARTLPPGGVGQRSIFLPLVTRR